MQGIGARKFAPWILVFAAIGTLIFTFFGDRSFRKLSELNKAVTVQREDNAKIKFEVLSLKRKIYGLMNDPRILEKAARNELGLAHPDELVFIFDDEE